LHAKIVDISLAGYGLDFHSISMLFMIIQLCINRYFVN